MNLDSKKLLKKISPSSRFSSNSDSFFAFNHLTNFLYFNALKNKEFRSYDLISWFVFESNHTSRKAT